MHFLINHFLTVTCFSYKKVVYKKLYIKWPKIKKVLINNILILRNFFVKETLCLQIFFEFNAKIARNCQNYVSLRKFLSISRILTFLKKDVYHICNRFFALIWIENDDLTCSITFAKSTGFLER